MSTLLEDAQALLSPLAAGGAWYMRNEAQPPVYPFIVFHRIVSTSNNSLSGPSDMQNTRFQIDVIAQRIEDADAVSKAIDAALKAWSVVNVPLSSQDMDEPELRGFRISKDVSVWASN